MEADHAALVPLEGAEHIGQLWAVILIAEILQWRGILSRKTGQCLRASEIWANQVLDSECNALIVQMFHIKKGRSALYLVIDHLARKRSS